MEYRVVFDVAEAGYRYWWFPCVGLVIVAIGVGQLLYRRRHATLPTSRWRRLEPAFTILFGAFVASVCFAGMYGEHRELVTALEKGNFSVVEGVVHDFVPMPFNGHPHESFEVDGRRYEYSDFDLTGGGFNNTQSHGGPMRDGLRVRIADVGGRIARLEIAR